MGACVRVCVCGLQKNSISGQDFVQYKNTLIVVVISMYL